MTLILDLETLFKVTEHPLCKDTLDEYEPDERRYASLDKRSQTDRPIEGRTDRQITIERPQSGAQTIRLVHRILQVLPFHIDEDVRLM